MFNNRIVWLFREPRSGGTWLSSYLAEKLNREFSFVDYDSLYQSDTEVFQKEGDEHRLLNTHYFKFARSMKNYKDPVIIRCRRIDSVEQFLSAMFCNLRNKFTNISSEEDKNVFDQDLKRIAEMKTELRREYFDYFLKQKEDWDSCWNQIVNTHESYDITYEDLTNGIDLFGFGKVDMKNYTEKFPENYKEIAFTNYNEVKQWVE